MAAGWGILIKLFASDLDGTLFNAIHETDNAILRRLRRVLDAGRHVVLATGRCPRRTSDLGFGDLPLESVGANGAYIIGRSGELLRYKPIDQATVEELITAFPDICFNCIGPEFTLIRGTREQFSADMPEAPGLKGALMRYGMRRAAKRGPGDAVFDQTDADVLAQSTCKMNFRASDPGERREVEAFLSEHAGTVVNASFDGRLFEVTAADVNKGEAVAWLAGELGIDESEVAVYGDGGNDIAMLERFDHAYATSNGSDEAKRAAGQVIGNCALHAVPRHIMRTVRREGPLP